MFLNSQSLTFFRDPNTRGHLNMMRHKQSGFVKKKKQKKNTFWFFFYAYLTFVYA